MNSLYDFVYEAESIQVDRLQSQQATLKEMAKQTIDCAHFIKTYADTQGFG